MASKRQAEGYMIRMLTMRGHSHLGWDPRCRRVWESSEQRSAGMESTQEVLMRNCSEATTYGGRDTAVPMLTHFTE